METQQDVIELSGNERADAFASRKSYYGYGASSVRATAAMPSMVRP
jgi:hypothetical protein